MYSSIAGHALGVRAARVAFWGSLTALVYVYALYPLLLSLLRLIARRPIQIARFEPSVCLFIAANDEAAVIAAKLDNALALDYPAGKLRDRRRVGRVGGRHRRDRSRGIAPRVQLISRSPRHGKIAAINHGLEHVSCDIVVFSDANTFLDRDAIRALVRNFGSDEVGCVSAAT